VGQATNSSNGAATRSRPLGAARLPSILHEHRGAVSLFPAHKRRNKRASVNILESQSGE
jgi:hypothetical protein